MWQCLSDNGKKLIGDFSVRSFVLHHGNVEQWGFE